MFLRQFHGMTGLYCFNVYQPLFGFLGLELGLFEFEARVGFEGLLLPYFCLEAFVPWCFEPEGLAFWCFEPEGLELGCFWGFWGLFFLPLGGYSSGGR